MAEGDPNNTIEFNGIDVRKLPRPKLLEAIEVAFEELTNLRSAQSEDERQKSLRDEEFQRNIASRHDYFGSVAEYQSRLMDSAAAYNQIIVGAAYAAFFGIWSTVRDEIPLWILLASGGAILISLIVFVAWTVLQMYQLQSQNMKTLQTFADGIEGFDERFRTAIAQGLENQDWVPKSWKWVVLASGGMGFIAAALLAYGCVTSIWSETINSNEAKTVAVSKQEHAPPSNTKTLDAKRGR